MAVPLVGLLVLAVLIWQITDSQTASRSETVSPQLQSRIERAHSKILAANPPQLGEGFLDCGSLWSADSTIVSVTTNSTVDCATATRVAQSYFGAPASPQSPATDVAGFSCRLFDPSIAPDPVTCVYNDAEIHIGYLQTAQEPS